MPEEIIWVLSNAVLCVCSPPKWWTHHKNTLVVLDAYNWTWDWIVCYLSSQCSKAIVKLSKETARYGLEAFDNKYEWVWMIVLTNGGFFFHVSPEELGKRQVGCTFCFTINTSETEGGLLFSCNAYTGNSTQVLQTLADSWESQDMQHDRHRQAMSLS